MKAKRQLVFVTHNPNIPVLGDADLETIVERVELSCGPNPFVLGASPATPSEDLARAVASMGARIEGAGSSTLEIEGRDELGGFHHRVIPDRIEAGTFLAAVAVAGGEIRLAGCRSDHLARAVGFNLSHQLSHDTKKPNGWKNFGAPLEWDHGSNTSTYR